MQSCTASEDLQIIQNCGSPALPMRVPGPWVGLPINFLAHFPIELCQVATEETLDRVGHIQFPAERLGPIRRSNTTLLVSPQNHVVDVNDVCKEQRKANGQSGGPAARVEILSVPPSPCKRPDLCATRMAPYRIGNVLLTPSASINRPSPLSAKGGQKRSGGMGLRFAFPPALLN